MLTVPVLVYAHEIISSINCSNKTNLKQKINYLD